MSLTTSHETSSAKNEEEEEKVLFSRIKMPFHLRHSCDKRHTHHGKGGRDYPFCFNWSTSDAHFSYDALTCLTLSLDDFIIQIAWKNSSLFFSLLAVKIKFFNCLLWLRVRTCMKSSREGKKYQIAAAAAAGLATFSAAPKKLKVENSTTIQLFSMSHSVTNLSTREICM